MLSEVAIDNPKYFAELVKVAKNALEGKMPKEATVEAKEEVKKTEKKTTAKTTATKKTTTKKTTTKKEVVSE